MKIVNQKIITPNFLDDLFFEIWYKGDFSIKSKLFNFGVKNFEKLSQKELNENYIYLQNLKNKVNVN